MKVIFLDIDGVLNDHQFDDAAQSSFTRYDCVQALNRIVTETAAQLVISSAWRYLVHGGALTLSGFQYLLRTHRVVCTEVVGVTAMDEQIPARCDQISDFLKRHPEIVSFVVLDDDAKGLPTSPLGARFVQTDGRRGLTENDADKAIAILNEM